MGLKLTDMAAAIQKQKGNEHLSSEEAKELAYAQERSRNAALRKENRALKASEKKPIAVEITTEGAFTINKFMKDGEFTSTARKPLITGSKTLESLSNLLRPMLMATKAMYTASGTINNHPLREMGEDGKYTKTPLKNEMDEQLYAMDPLSQLKIVVSVLENNKDAQKALDTIRDVLKDYSTSQLKELQNTEKNIKAINVNDIPALRSLNAGIGSLTPSDGTGGMDIT